MQRFHDGPKNTPRSPKEVEVAEDVNSKASSDYKDDRDQFDPGNVIGPISDTRKKFDETNDHNEHTVNTETKHELSELSKEHS